MDRREFIKKSTLMGAGLAGAGLLKPLTEPAYTADAYNAELIVAQGGEPEQLLQAALAAYGGLKKLVKPGGTVIIKANFSWVGPPEQACNTNPDLLAALVKACKVAGAKRVRVVDIAIEPAVMTLERSGIEKAVERAGGEIENWGFSSPLVKKSYGTLSDFSVCEEALKAECLINVPIIKHHRVTEYTGALKNMMGLTPSRRQMHSMGTHRTIADLAAMIKPHLHIMDAYRVLKSNGPNGPGEVQILKQLIITHDPVAGDAYGASLLGRDPAYLEMAAKNGLGCSDLARIKVTKVKA